MISIKTEWHGPYSIIPIEVESVTWLAEEPQALRPGVYLWTARVGDEYRVNYIGMSTNSVTARTMEHVSRSFGVNDVENPNLFRQGKKGDCLFSRSKHEWNDVRDDILPDIIEYLREIRMFFAPVNIDGFAKYGADELKRIESALIEQIRTYDLLPTSERFLTNNRLSRKVAMDDRNISVNISMSPKLSLCGISEAFDA